MNQSVLSQLNYGKIHGPAVPAQSVDAVCLRKRTDAVPQIQMGKWCRRYGASQAGLEPANTGLASGGSLTVSNHPFDVSDNLQLSAHRNLKMVRKPGLAPGPSPSRGEMLLLHHDPDWKWSLWSDSHRRIAVYETAPVAAEAQRQKKMMKVE